MFGGYIAEKLYRAGEDIGLRVLVLDAGAFLVTTHIQNLPRLGLGVPGGVAVPTNDQDPGTQAVVWGYPWHSNQPFPGLAYCIGGRSIYWGGWSPRMTDADLAAWPSTVKSYLQNNYATVEEETGVAPTTDYISGKFYDALLKLFKNAAPAEYEVAEAPLAIQGKANDSGLFAFDKYSSANLLIDAIRDDVGRRGKGASNDQRRLMLLPRAHVNQLWMSNGQKVDAIDVSIEGQERTLMPPLISPNCSVILASSTIEATRLAMESFRTPRMGSNLMAHLRSNITLRVPRSCLPDCHRSLSISKQLR
jgi:choline dehydrogenase-like flavoprotein